MTPWHPLLARWQRRPAQAAPSSRIEVCPPAMWPSSVSLWGRLLRWLAAPNPWTSGPGRPLNRMVLARNEFLAALSDIPGSEAGALADRIERARSLRELWHLRSSLYGVVALALSQTDAEGRLIKLNRYFPTRAPKSGLASSYF